MSGPAVAAAQEPAATEMGFAILGDTFVAIQVRDVGAAAEWYRGALGLVEVNRLEAEDGAYSIRLLSGSGLRVELIRIRGAAAPAAGPRLGLFKSGFFVDDVEAALGWLRDYGASTDDAAFFDAALNARSFVFRDPYGNRIQVFQDCETGCGQAPG